MCVLSSCYSRWVDSVHRCPGCRCPVLPIPPALVQPVSNPSPAPFLLQALSRASSRSSSRSVSRTSSGVFDASPLPPVAAGGGLVPQSSIGSGLGGRGVLETALQSIRRGSNVPAVLARPQQPASPDQGPSSGLRISPGAAAYLPPPDNDFEPFDSDLDSPHPSGRRMSGMGPEPPSPISLMPRWEPPSPIDLRPRAEPPSPGSGGGQQQLGAAPPITISLRPQVQPPSPMSLRPRAEPPSPISLLPRVQPPSPGALSPVGSAGRGSPGYRPYTSYVGNVGSPIISLAAQPRREPASPLGTGRSPGPLDGAGGSGMFSPTARASGPGTGEWRLHWATEPSGLGCRRGPSASPLSCAAQLCHSSMQLTWHVSPACCTHPYLLRCPYILHLLPSRPACAPTGGLTLQQILQQYSSSGYKSRGASSRRNSIDVPAGGRRSMDAGSVGGSIARESILSQSAVSDLDDVTWLGDN